MDYEAIVYEAISKLGEIDHKLESLQAERAKIHQFIAATIPMLPREKAMVLGVALKNELQKRAQADNLTEATYRVLQEFAGEYRTVAAIRDQLIRNGFDFSEYTSNPLASVSTTIKRIAEKDDKVDTGLVEGGSTTVYRLRQAASPLTLKDLIVQRKTERKLK